MKKVISPFESQIENDLPLNDTAFLKSKESLLSLIEPYSPPENQVLSFVMPIPERNDTVLFYQQRPYHCPNQTFTTLQKYAVHNNFFDYLSLSRAIKRFSCFKKRNIPMVSLSLVLFPLEQPNHSLWLNPLEIYDLKEVGLVTWIQLVNGTVIQTPLSIRTIRNRSEQALAILSMLRRDFLETGPAGSASPLAVLELPNTPFLRSIRNRAMLRDFPLPMRALREAYEKEFAIQAFLRLGSAMNLEGWTYDQLSELFEALTH